MDGERGMGAALGEAEDGIGRDLIHESDTAAAHDAALVVEADAWADIDVLRLFHFHVHEPGHAAAVLDGLLLQAALAGLIANRTVQRVIDEKELHDAFAALFHEIAGGADAHIFADGIRAGDDGAGNPADDFIAIPVPLRLLAGGGTGGHAHLDEAHAAVARRAELRMVTIVGDRDLRLAAGLDHAGAFGKLVPNAINLDVDHAFFRRKVFRQFDFRSRRRCVAHGRSKARRSDYARIARRVLARKYVQTGINGQACFVKTFTSGKAGWLRKGREFFGILQFAGKLQEFQGQIGIKGGRNLHDESGL